MIFYGRALMMEDNFFKLSHTLAQEHNNFAA